MTAEPAPARTRRLWQPRVSGGFSRDNAPGTIRVPRRPGWRTRGWPGAGRGRAGAGGFRPRCRRCRCRSGRRRGRARCRRWSADSGSRGVAGAWGWGAGPGTASRARAGPCRATGRIFVALADAGMVGRAVRDGGPAAGLVGQRGLQTGRVRSWHGRSFPGRTFREPCGGAWCEDQPGAG